jgi:hypothetical protein
MSLFVVLGGVGGVGPAGGGGPAHDAGLGLLEFPAGGVLGVVVAFAGGGEVSLAGRPGRVRDGVVDLAGDGLGAAAGRAAAGRAGADQVLQLPAGDVAVLAVAVVAELTSQRNHRLQQLATDAATGPIAGAWRRQVGQHGAEQVDGVESLASGHVV